MPGSCGEAGSFESEFFTSFGAPGTDCALTAGWELIIAPITVSETFAALSAFNPAMLVSKAVASAVLILATTTSLDRPIPTNSVTSALVIWAAGCCPRQRETQRKQKNAMLENRK